MQTHPKPISVDAWDILEGGPYLKYSYSFLPFHNLEINVTPLDFLVTHVKTMLPFSFLILLVVCRKTGKDIWKRWSVKSCVKQPLPAWHWLPYLW